VNGNGIVDIADVSRPAGADRRLIDRCPVGCASTLDPTEIALPEGVLLRCRECGQLVSQIGAAAYARSMQAFDAPAFNRPTAREMTRRRRVAHRRLAHVARLLGKPPAQCRLVDVGCSRGDFVAFAHELGFAAEGVEPAPHIAAEARAAGRNVRTGLLEEQAYDDAGFDCVTLFEVIEHLARPLTVLAECRRILAPGGILLLSTGNGESWTARALKGRWDYFRIDKDAGHVSFFNPRSLALAAERAGFAVAGLETARARFAEKEDASPAIYALARVASELADLPARLLGRGHGMVAYLRSRST
jgi:SAM-dependent methyltransferase